MYRRTLGPLLAVLLTLLALTAACAQAPPATTSPATTKPLDVPYVPTHELIVTQMLDMGRVRGNDVLYDLGSGDGRIVIEAARRFGTRGVGYDIDPERIREANENAVRAGVKDKVRFIEGDIFDANIQEATVVTLYLLPAVNLRLKPKLLRDLKPGTRIVSHNYDMGDDWPPETTARITVDGTEHTVYFWTIPRRGATR
jgi:SAM-dependent methyltransferase